MLLKVRVSIIKMQTTIYYFKSKKWRDKQFKGKNKIFKLNLLPASNVKYSKGDKIKTW